MCVCVYMCICDRVKSQREIHTFDSDRSKAVMSERSHADVNAWMHEDVCICVCVCVCVGGCV